jgi:hypothetical protein
MDTVEEFCVYKEVTDDNHLIEKHNFTPNKIFETVLKSECHIV